MMNQGKIEVIYGNGSSKSELALGRGIKAMALQKSVIIIQFLKGCQRKEELEVYNRLEPQIKVFCFEKSDCNFEQLSETERQDELMNIRNCINYTRKVLTTGECDLLILDGILGLVKHGILKVEELETLLSVRDEADVLLTGEQLPDSLRVLADRIEYVQVDN
ncbi:MAG: cob(I)yrinic acid a,c-diamide adenosyltransferase [Lachnospiraceae bacterium]